ncbi:MAG: c-type cytochrome [Sandaracinaceae bacterium]|nr:c-type cytochrome [Sandaracinaceae bacterium]
MLHRASPLVLVGALLAGCPTNPQPPPDIEAEGVSAPLGEILPSATESQRATFERGRAVAVRRFTRADGLGPAFNVTFCGACHERPATGGGAGLYRNFFFGGVRQRDGSFNTTQSAGNTSGVIRLYAYGDEFPARPGIPPETNVIGQRNPIPFFGVGLLAEVSAEEILSRADPDDLDEDGISGRANYENGFVGRFGVKAQSAAVEGFIRGPLFNHAGITTEPLTEQQRAMLPVDSSQMGRTRQGLVIAAQASAPGSPTTDMDGVPDPELAPSDLFDVISFAMLLAAPEAEAPTAVTIAGRERFEAAGCEGCHVETLRGPRGHIHPFSDLLIHDMGPELADGLPFGLATGSEFRTQPLWGIAATGPYLHDGRAGTIDEAIRMHAGEAEISRDAYLALSDDERSSVIEFLLSLGGRDQHSEGLLPPGAPTPAEGTYGGPVPGLAAGELARFERGRRLFDREFAFSEGTGAPRFNGDSCRACHFDPVLGGAGPRDVNVTRHGFLSPDGRFVPPTVGTILHRENALHGEAMFAQTEATIFEHRQTPPLFGLGLIEGIDPAVIEALADPDDTLSPDGITGRVSYADGGVLGRFGWKGQVPSIEEFVRDALSAEIGLTVPYREGLVFGRLRDNDAIDDPEVDQDLVDDLAFFLRNLGAPPRTVADDPALASRGEPLFTSAGCASCHVPELPGADGPVALYSDLLLHEILAEGAVGIEDASASMRELRTPPLWGLATSAPYLHSGAADTIEQSIAAHEAEGAASRDAFAALSADDRAALLAFLETL